jgi:prolyl-tRNA synthetase
MGYHGFAQAQTLCAMAQAANARPMKHALSVTRRTDFAAWYQEVIAEAEMAEESGVRGCMVIRPWGYGIWERIQHLMDARIKAAGVDNCYFPLFIPLSYFAKEAEHVDGFAKEMAVVTHHRLIQTARAAGPRSRSQAGRAADRAPDVETVIGAAMARWVQSGAICRCSPTSGPMSSAGKCARGCSCAPANSSGRKAIPPTPTAPMRWPKRCARSKCTAAHAEDVWPCRCSPAKSPRMSASPARSATYSIEAMMQDGKALQAGTSHYLGTGFAEAAGIRIQDKEGQQQLCHTTSWGVSTRLIGGVIMTHGDDDGLRVPPRIAPHQIVILPMLRDTTGRRAARLLRGSAPLARRADRAGRTGARAARQARWQGGAKALGLGQEGRAADPRDRRTRCRWRASVGDPARPALSRRRQGQFVGQGKDAFLAARCRRAGRYPESAPPEATARRDAQIERGVSDLAGLEAFFADSNRYPGWVEVSWSRPTGAALEAVVAKLKGLKLTVRNTPMDGAPVTGICPFTGEPAVERIYVARAY